MKLSLKDSLFLGFCSVFIVGAKAALRLHLKIPGHSMFLTLFFMLIARGCVANRLAASFTGLLAGILAMGLGMGKGGPLLIIKFMLPGMVVDLMAFMLPGLFNSVILCMVTAGLAGSTRFFSTFIVDMLAGMDGEIVIQHALLKSAANVAFAMAGGAAVPAVIRKLKAYGAVTVEDRGLSIAAKE